MRFTLPSSLLGCRFRHPDVRARRLGARRPRACVRTSPCRSTRCGRSSTTTGRSRGRTSVQPRTGSGRRRRSAIAEHRPEAYLQWSIDAWTRRADLARSAGARRRSSGGCSSACRSPAPARAALATRLLQPAAGAQPAPDLPRPGDPQVRERHGSHARDAPALAAAQRARCPRGLGARHWTCWRSRPG